MTDPRISLPGICIAMTAAVVLLAVLYPLLRKHVRPEGRYLLWLLILLRLCLPFGAAPLPALWELPAEQEHIGMAGQVRREFIEGHRAIRVSGTVDRHAVSSGGQRENEDGSLLGGLLQSRADAKLGGPILQGEAMVAASQEADGIAFLGQAFRQVGHTPVAPDDREGESVGGRGWDRDMGHGRSLLSGALVTGDVETCHITGYAECGKKYTKKERGDGHCLRVRFKRLITYGTSILWRSDSTDRRPHIGSPA